MTSKANGNIQNIGHSHGCSKLTTEDYFNLSMSYKEDLESTLKSNEKTNSTYKIYSTHITQRQLDDNMGDKIGNFETYISINFGGTKLSVFLIKVSFLCSFQPNFEVLKHVEHIIPESLKSKEEKAENLFQFVAKACYDLCESQEKRDLFNSEGQNLIKAGFCFSFPFTGERINEGILSFWTKGFETQGCVGYDIVKIFNHQLEIQGKKIGFHIVCTAILNDSTAGFLGFNSHDKNCRISLILGTGTNCCFLDPTSQKLINTEWGNYLMRNVEELSGLKTEPLVSGKYIGELIRNELTKIYPELTDIHPYLKNENSITSKDISELLEGQNDFLNKLEASIENLKKTDTPLLKSLCESIIDRSASIFASLTFGVSAVMDFNREISSDEILLGIDGSVIQKMYGYKEKVLKRLENLKDFALKNKSHNLKFNGKFTFVEVDESPIKGAAVAAYLNEEYKTNDC